MTFPEMGPEMTPSQETTVGVKEDLDQEGGEFLEDGEESFLQ